MPGEHLLLCFCVSGKTAKCAWQFGVWMQGSKLDFILITPKTNSMMSGGCDSNGKLSNGLQWTTSTDHFRMQVSPVCTRLSLSPSLALYQGKVWASNSIYELESLTIWTRWKSLRLQLNSSVFEPKSTVREFESTSWGFKCSRSFGSTSQMFWMTHEVAYEQLRATFKWFTSKPTSNLLASLLETFRRDVVDSGSLGFATH